MIVSAVEWDEGGGRGGARRRGVDGLETGEKWLITGNGGRKLEQGVSLTYM